MSVYDLKDHPDFKFRPGSIVVRVADPCGSSSVGSAGQVLDNHTNGQVIVGSINISAATFSRF